jgi:carbon monoxide dehydrogenase subunit G
MKTAIHLFLFVFLFLALNLSAQQSYNCTLSGKVSDKDSKVPLPGVTVIVSDKTHTDAVSTDANGDFKFSNLKPGRVNIKCTMIGFEEVTVSEVLLTTGKQTIINISIQEKVNEMKEVVIKSDRSKYRARNEFAAVSSQSFSVEETKRYAATLNDPARMAQSFAGVVSSNDESNQIVVRGNSPRGMLWRLEGSRNAEPKSLCLF